MAGSLSDKKVRAEEIALEKQRISNACLKGSPFVSPAKPSVQGKTWRSSISVGEPAI